MEDQHAALSWCFLAFCWSFDDSFFGLLFEAELAAGGIDVVALFQSEICGDSGVFQDLLECAAVVVRRAFPFQSFDRVVWDEIHFCA